MIHSFFVRQLAVLCQIILPIFALIFGSNLLAADSVVTALRISPDGTHVVAARNHQLSFYDLPTLSLQNRIDFGISKIHDLQFSPDGKTLFVSGGNPGESGIVQVCRHPFEQAGATYSIHKDSVFSIRWLQHSQHVVSASLDGNVLLFDLKQNKIIRDFQGHSKGVTALEVLQDEAILVTASVDQSLRVWNIETGERIRTLNNHTGSIHDIKARPQAAGLPIVASVANDRTVRFWQPTIGRMVRFVKLDSIPLAVVWHPVEPIVVVTTSTGQVLVIDSRTAAIVKQIQTDQAWLHAIAISPNGNFVIIASETGLQNLPVMQSSE